MEPCRKKPKDPALAATAAAMASGEYTPCGTKTGTAKIRTKGRKAVSTALVVEPRA